MNPPPVSHSPSLEVPTDSSKKPRPWWDKARIQLPLAFILTPVGVPLLWIGKRFSLAAKITITILAVFIYTNKPDNSANSTTPTPPAGEMTFEYARQEVERIAKKKLGGSLVKAEVFETARGQEEGLYNVNLRFNGQDSWSPSMTKQTIEWQMQDVYQALYEANLNIRDIYCFASLKLTDQFGQEDVSVVYKTSLGRAVAEKVNWERKRSLDFSNIWEPHFIHPSFYR